MIAAAEVGDQKQYFAEALIPGLPDDIAVACLLRLPLASLPAMRAVSRRWRCYILSHKFIRLRRSLRLWEERLSVLAYHRSTGRMQWQALDPATKSWLIMPEMPCEKRVCPPGFGCVAMAEEGTLFVCGGMASDADCPLDSVMKYEMHTNRWTQLDRMSSPRGFFASGVIDGRIYVAGGHMSSDLGDVSSAEVYAEGQWRAVASMGEAVAPHDWAVVNGKLYVTQGWVWPFFCPLRGVVYDPKSDTWESMKLGMREGWRGVSAVVDGFLFVIPDGKDRKEQPIKVYDMEHDTWKAVRGSPIPIPSDVATPFSAAAINGKLFVVGCSLHVADYSN
eukprot:Gb_02722 [translate_table: standard]